MALELIILEGSQAGRRISLSSGPVTFGRSPTAAMPFPQDNFMSSQHMTAEVGPKGVLVSDLRSTNGTFVNGERITQMVAGAGAIIKIGSLTMQVIHQMASPTGPVLSSPMVRPSPAPTAASGATSTFVLPQQHSGVLGVLSQAPGTIYCLLDAAADQMIPSLLGLAAERKECLYDGDSAVTLSSWAPYLVALSADSPLLSVLVDKGWGKGWASYFVSASPFEELRKHFRRFLMVQVEGGKEVYFRFYDPRVLRDFLPTANAHELTTFFGPVAEWMIEAEGARSVLKARNSAGGLMMETVTPTVRITAPDQEDSVPR